MTPSLTRLRQLAVVLLAAFSACSTQPDKRILQHLNTAGFGKSYTGNAEEENYITIGDSLAVTDTYNPEDIQANERVAIDGTVLLPDIGSVHVAGMTRTEIEAFLTDKYSRYYDLLDIHVKIQSAQGKFYFIYGEVGAQGRQQFPGDLTIWEAVMKAGPRKETANLGRVRLIHADPRDPFVMTLDLTEVIETGDTTFNVKVRELDIIYVPPTMLAQVGYFLNTLLFPVKMVLSGLSDAARTLLNLSLVGSNRRYNNNQGNFFATGVF